MRSITLSCLGGIASPYAPIGAKTEANRVRTPRYDRCSSIGWTWSARRALEGVVWRTKSKRGLMTGIVIRNGRQEDLPSLVKIFNHYIVDGHVTFDTELTSVADRQPWFATYGSGRHQLIVAEEEGRVLGCAYSSRYRQHPAFDATVETSIYLDRAERGRGTGSRLYVDLLKRLETQDVHLAVAGIALPNDASIALHRKLGFDEVGIFKEYAIKHGELISSSWFQRRIHPAI
jgi:phosphinothricin acetyltransferase